MLHLSSVLTLPLTCSVVDTSRLIKLTLNVKPSPNSVYMQKSLIIWLSNISPSRKLIARLFQVQV